MTDEANTAQAALAELGRQRAVLADRIRLPLWHWALSTVATFCTMTLFAIDSDKLLLSLIMVLAAGVQLADYLSFRPALRRASGALISREPFKAYPSIRTPSYIDCGVIFGGILLGGLLWPSDPWQLALVWGALVAVAHLCVLHLEMRAIRSDIRAGRVNS